MILSIILQWYCFTQNKDIIDLISGSIFLYNNIGYPLFDFYNQYDTSVNYNTTLSFHFLLIILSFGCFVEFIVS